MKISIKIITLLSALILGSHASTVFAQTNGAQIRKSIQEFQVDGVSLGMTETAFRELFPEAKSLNHVSGPQVVNLRVDSTSRTDGIDVVIFKGKVIDFNVYYFQSKVAAFGGKLTLVQRLVDRFGLADSDSPGNSTEDGSPVVQLRWRLPDYNFYAFYKSLGDHVKINVTNMQGWSEMLQARAAIADPGF